MNHSLYAFTTQPALRKAFWSGLNRKPVAGWTQNDYSALMRSEWVDFIDGLQKSGCISEALAQRATL